MDYINPPRESVVSLNQKIDELQPKFTYFFERLSNREVIPMDSEDAAWDTYKRNRDFRFLGRTDGRLMLQAVKEAQIIFKAEGLQKAQERIRAGQQEEIDRCEQDKTPPNNRDVFGNGANEIRNNISKYGR